MSFPDAPGAFTQGDDDADAHAMAAAAFGLMLAQYLADGKSLPEPSRQGKGQIMITAEPDLSKAGQCEGWVENSWARVSPSELTHAKFRLWFVAHREPARRGFRPYR